jgi:hypothetical protein
MRHCLDAAATVSVSPNVDIMQPNGARPVLQLFEHLETFADAAPTVSLRSAAPAADI